MTEQHNVDLEKRLLAAAVFELRVLLSNHLDPQDQSAAGVAAQFAYALHNQALAALSGRPFDVAQTLDSLGRLEPQLGSAYLQQFRQVVTNEA
ncbi:hypothetical protein [Pseudoxanthomonas sp. 3HH-4]|uniref:hypothetical protein n=1 Tax=Pseudoxanthomonas sp. 3HH-4 TaxID=1690214 RepID=UPI001154B8DB|nr:hypothetical protein [Pseudoxanthomonas sp. 3HH-4]